MVIVHDLFVDSDVVVTFCVGDVLVVVRSRDVFRVSVWECHSVDSVCGVGVCCWKCKVKSGVFYVDRDGFLLFVLVRECWVVVSWFFSSDGVVSSIVWIGVYVKVNDVCWITRYICIITVCFKVWFFLVISSSVEDCYC